MYCFIIKNSVNLIVQFNKNEMLSIGTVTQAFCYYLWTVLAHVSLVFRCCLTLLLWACGENSISQNRAVYLGRRV